MPHNITAQRFGKLLAISRSEKTDYGWRWNCICDCGNRTQSFELE